MTRVRRFLAGQVRWLFTANEMTVEAVWRWLRGRRRS